MRIFISLTIVASDVPPAVSLLEMQNTLVERFFAEAHRDYIKFQSSGDPNICNWVSSGADRSESPHLQTTCVDDVLTEISINLRNVRPQRSPIIFPIGYCPQTVQRLRISQAFQNYPIDTRAFPRAAVEVNLRTNEIHGCPELTILPTKLVELDLSENLICGPIFLTKLPPTLIFLYLDKNPQLNQKVVLFDNLPEHIEIARFDGRRIGKIKDVTGARYAGGWVEFVRA